MILASLFLGRWWSTLVSEPGRFGAEYRELRLGRVLGIATTLVFILALAVHLPVLQALAWVR